MFKRSVKMGAWCGVLISILLVGTIKREPITGVLAACAVLLLCFCLSILWQSVCAWLYEFDKEAVLDKLAKKSIFNF